MPSSTTPKARPRKAAKEPTYGVYAAAIARQPVWTRDEEHEAGNRLMAVRASGNSASLKGETDRWVRANLRLVFAIAARYQNRGVPFADLVQEGTMGLLTAIEKFDPTRGVRFASYATWWIRATIARSVGDTRATIRVPNHAQETLAKAEKVNARTRAALGRDATPAEKAAGADNGGRRLSALMGSHTGRILELDALVFDEEQGLTRLDTLRSETPDPETALIAKERAEDARRRLKTLDPKERQIVSARFSDKEPTLDETSELFGLGYCRERVRQIQEDGLRRLRIRALNEAAAE